MKCVLWLVVRHHKRYFNLSNQFSDVNFIPPVGVQRFGAKSAEKNKPTSALAGGSPVFDSLTFLIRAPSHPGGELFGALTLTESSRSRAAPHRSPRVEKRNKLSCWQRKKTIVLVLVARFRGDRYINRPEGRLKEQSVLPTGSYFLS